MELPTDQILKNCFENNPDGAGFAYNLDGRVIIKKGFMNFDKFLNAIHKADERFNLKDRGMLIHTRITTHGGTCPEMTHPFPICADEGALKKPEYCSPYACIHNGVISLTSTEATRRKTISDTAVFVEKYLSKIASNKDWFDNEANIEMIEDLIDSKMAILNGEGKIIKTSGFTADNGIYYSNSSYKDYYTRYCRTYDYYDDDYYYSNYKSYKKKEEENTKSTSNGNWLEENGYVYNSETHCWSKPHTESNSKSVMLMKMRPSEFLVLDDGTCEEYCEEIQYFINKDNEVYYLLKETKEDLSFTIKDNLEYLGTGDFYDSTYSLIRDFRIDHCTCENNLG